MVHKGEVACSKVRCRTSAATWTSQLSWMTPHACCRAAPRHRYQRTILYTCTTKRAICKDGCNADGVPDAQGDGVLTRGVRRGVGTIRPKTSWGFHRSLHPEGRVLHIKYLGGYTGLSCQHCVARWGWVWGSCVSWSCVSRTASVCRCRTHHVRLDYKESRR